MPVYPLHTHMLRFIFSFPNMVDLVTFLPYYITLGTKGHGVGATFLRVFRLLRAFKLMNKSRVFQDMLVLITETVDQSMPALFVLLVISLLTMVFYGSLVFIAEEGTYRVTSEYPEGA